MCKFRCLDTLKSMKCQLRHCIKSSDSLTKSNNLSRSCGTQMWRDELNDNKFAELRIIKGVINLGSNWKCGHVCELIFKEILIFYPDLL